jgi:co-chaperonin GroES (HSP10)
MAKKSKTEPKFYPLGDNVLVFMETKKEEETSSSGIILNTTTSKSDKATGKVVAVSGTCSTEISQLYNKNVMFSNGKRINLDKDYLLVNARDIFGQVEDKKTTKKV